ncbi:unnamed protein product [Spirodela intermedia]|nr:unnamed protein product [Spirodela intermedia]CAA6672156.1 unnamed protein product [Spirodela intermedia]
MVKLKRFVRRWRPLSFRRHSAAVGDISGASGLLRRVPAGFLAVYVGPERRRFVIPTRFLTFPVFSSLLTRAEEEFGFSAGGGLALPCAAEFFRRVLEILDSDEARFRDLALEGFVELSGLAGPETFDLPSARCRQAATFPAPPPSPLLLLQQKTSV